MAGLETLTESMGKLLNVAPQAYDDLIKPSAQAAGQMLAFPLELVSALLVRPRCWIANAEYKIKETNILIAKKLKNVEKNNIVAPEDYIAVPALQALSYSMDCEELRNIYANILAGAMNSATKSKVHPAYVEIVKQLSPVDIKIFNDIGEHCVNDMTNGLVCANVKLIKDEDNIIVLPYITGEDSMEDFMIGIDNLVRCNLLYNVLSRGVIIDDLAYSYETVEKWNSVKKYLDQGYIIENIGSCAFSLTELGREFYTICCADVDKC